MDSPPSLIIDFDPPLTWNGQTTDAIELREPKAMEVVKAQSELNGVSTSGHMKFGIALIAGVSGKPRQVIEQMPISQLMKGIDYLTGFIAGGPATGEN